MAVFGPIFWRSVDVQPFLAQIGYGRCGGRRVNSLLANTKRKAPGGFPWAFSCLKLMARIVFEPTISALTGRAARTRLKNRWGQPRVSSTLTFGTTF